MSVRERDSGVVGRRQSTEMEQREGERKREKVRIDKTGEREKMGTGVYVGFSA